MVINVYKYYITCWAENRVRESFAATFRYRFVFFTCWQLVCRLLTEYRHVCVWCASSVWLNCSAVAVLAAERAQVLRVHKVATTNTENLFGKQRWWRWRIRNVTSVFRHIASSTCVYVPIQWISLTHFSTSQTQGDGSQEQILYYFIVTSCVRLLCWRFHSATIVGDKSRRKLFFVVKGGNHQWRTQGAWGQ